MGDRYESFPIFPLPLVLLPTELAPLHIFEERYKRMINLCIEEATEFGIVWLGDERAARTIGCTARITELIDRMDDGRMNILVRGEQPVPAAAPRRRAAPTRPATSSCSTTTQDASGLARRGRAVELRGGRREGHRRAARRTTDLAEMDAYGMAATIELEPALKQKLLDSRSEDERLEIVEELFRRRSSASSAPSTCPRWRARTARSVSKGV